MVVLMVMPSDIGKGFDRREHYYSLHYGLDYVLHESTRVVLGSYENSDCWGFMLHCDGVAALACMIFVIFKRVL